MLLLVLRIVEVAACLTAIPVGLDLLADRRRRRRFGHRSAWEWSDPPPRPRRPARLYDQDQEDPWT